MSVAREKPPPGYRFQAADMLANRGLAKAKPPASLGKMPRLHHCQKRP
jgi:hypothetical protein